MKQDKIPIELVGMKIKHGQDYEIENEPGYQSIFAQARFNIYITSKYLHTVGRLND